MRNVLGRISQALQNLYDRSELDVISKALCMELLGVGESDYWLKSELPSDKARDELLDSALERLAKGEPLQYVLGTAPFLGMDFKVGPGVLIPRPETAQLVEWVESICTGRRGRMLDIGTGSGCIAVSLAVRLRSWEVDAWDISPVALETASYNAKANDADVSFSLHDILNEQGSDCEYDVIVSNPPYVLDRERQEMQKTVLDYEPSLALFVPDNDPLVFYRSIARFGQNALKCGGRLFFEINPITADALAGSLDGMGYADIEIKNDIFGKRRMMGACWPGEKQS